MLLRILNYSKIFNCVSPREKLCYTGRYSCLVTLRFFSSLTLRASVHGGCIVLSRVIFHVFSSLLRTRPMPCALWNMNYRKN